MDSFERKITTFGRDNAGFQEITLECGHKAVLIIDLPPERESVTCTQCIHGFLEDRGECHMCHGTQLIDNQPCPMCKPLDHRFREMFYILRDRVPRPPKTLNEFFEFRQQQENSIVKQEDVGPYFVSTVFLGINMDHFHVTETGIWFETMISDQRGWGNATRYETWEDAEKGHAEVVARLYRELNG